MSAWDDVENAIDRGDANTTLSLVSALGEEDRRSVAKELPGKLKAMRAASVYGTIDRRRGNALLLAGAGTIGGAAAAAAWICRTDLRPGWSDDLFTALCSGLAEVTAVRSVEWRAEVAHRIGDRVRTTIDSWDLWELSATLTKSADAAPPVSDGFVVGWADYGTRPEDLAKDPFLDTLVPKLFEVDGVGAALAYDEASPERDDSRTDTWIDALTSLARAGRIDRVVLLDGCVSRFLRGGTAHNLRWFVRLHDALEPAETEAADRVRDYVRLLEAAPSTVADLALRQVRRADGLGRLDEALFAEAAAALLFRPEKKLVRAALTWLDRTARDRGRVGATLGALPAVFASDALDLRERAVKLAVKHAGEAAGPVREEIRDAAGGLPAALRDMIAEAFGAVEAREEPEPLMDPPPFVPRRPPVPIGSPAELTEEITVLRRSERPWAAVERFLGALIEFAYRDPAGTKEALQRYVSAHEPWLLDQDTHSYMRDHIQEDPVLFPVQRLLDPSTAPRPFEKLAAFVKDPVPSFQTRFEPRLQRFLALRRHEIAAAAGRTPVLLATPTEGSGHVDPDVLVRRLERLEEAGAEPGRADLAQAMLRVPREIDPAAAARAKRLESEAGRTAASWLAGGGLGDPAVACRVLDRPLATVDGRTLALPHHILCTVDVPGDSDIARLCSFPEPGWKDSATPPYYRSTAAWPSVLPSHREVAAAQLVACLAGAEDADWGQGAVMLDLAEADGPAGPATGTLLAGTLANRHERERSGAVDALLALGARGALPAAETGEALGRLAALGRVTLPRAVKALTSAADAGARTDVWTVLAAALPHALPAPGGRAAAGAPDLLALAARLAETTGARGPIPAVAEVAARGGSSRLVQESARLHRALAT